MTALPAPVHTEGPVANSTIGTAGPERSWWWLAAAAVAVTPVLVALWSVHDRSWSLTGDWASIDLRVRQVGTGDTPLIGAYSTRGWAHPGPVLFWLAAPVQWAVGGDPRGLYVTAAMVNIASVVAMSWVAHRRQGPGMACAVGTTMAVLVYGLRPNRVMDIWNPLLPLFPLLLVAFLAWSAATGHRRHAVPALVLGALVAQMHVGLVPVLVVIGAWALAWVAATQRGNHRQARSAAGAEAGPAEDAARGDEADEDPGPTAADPSGSEDQTQRSWRRVLLTGAALASVTWVPPLIDQLWVSHNLGRVLSYFTSGEAEPVGLGRGAGLVARFVRPDGPWMGGPEPLKYLSMVGSSALWIVPVASLLLALTVWSWRCQDLPTAAGTSLALTLVVLAVPIAGRLDEPVFDYLVRWVEVLGAFAWFWVGWGLWRRMRPAVPDALVTRAPAVAMVAIGAIAWGTSAGATDFKLQGENEAVAVQATRHRLEAAVEEDQLIRIEHRGDTLGNVTSGVIYWLRRDGYRVVTSDGYEGLKYGPAAVWRPGDPPVGSVYTVVVDYPRRYRSASDECAKAGGVRQVTAYDDLSQDEREELQRLTAKRFFSPDEITGAERRAARRLGGRDFRVTVFVGADVCGSGP